MSQTREGWNSPCLFLFRTNGKRTIIWKRFLSLLWYFFRKYHSSLHYLIEPCSKFFCKTLWQRYITVDEILRTWIIMWSNFFLSKYLSTKIGESAWKIIIYTIIRVCSSKNIAQDISLIIVCFFFSQINLVYEFYIALFR